MKNAHERFGKLVYRRRTEKTATNLRVFLDAFVGEERGKAHLVSVVGGDVEVGALAAAFANGDSFTVVDPYGAESIVSLGEKPLCLRGSIVVQGRKRPLRHLVSCSQELADTTSDGKMLLISDDQSFIWSSLVSHYGLPATPEWGAWMISQLQLQKRIQPLLGFGYEGVAVKAKRKELLALLRKRLRSDHLAFPAQNGAVEWPEIQLITLNRKCKYLKRRTTARLGRGARLGRVWDGFTCRKNWRRTFGFGSKSAQILHPMPSSFPMRKVGLWTPAIIENGCYISWHETSGCPS